jgi:copper transport protein
MIDRPRRRSAARAVVATTLLAGTLVLLGAPAAAHTDAVATSPRAGQVLAEAPEQVSVVFNDPVNLKTAQVRVVEGAGDLLAGVGPPRHVEGREATLGATLPRTLEPGTHTVVWRVASEDGHPIQGSFTFSVGVTGPTAGAAAIGEGDPGLRLVAGLARWAAFGGLAVAVGTIFFLAAWWPAGAAERRARNLFWAGAGTLAVGTVSGLACYGPYLAGGTLSGAADVGALRDTLGTRTGLLLTVRLGLLLAFGFAAAAALRRWAVPGAEPAEAEVRRRAVAVLAAAVALAATWSLATHSATGAGLAVAVPVDIVHLVAMSIWLGGVVTLAGVLLRSHDTGAIRTAIPSFSRAAAVCVAALVITGCYQAWRQVGSPAALRDTTYGGILLAKVGGVAALVAFGAKARRWTGHHLRAGRAAGCGRHPRPGSAPPSVVAAVRAAGGAGTMVRAAAAARTAISAGEMVRLRRSVMLEAGVGVVVLGLTAVLVSVQPARTAHAAARAAAHVSALGGATPVAAPVDIALGLELRKDGFTAPPDKATGSGWVLATISPAANGLPNEVHVAVTDTADKPIDVKGVGIDLRKRGSSQASQQYPLLPSGPGHYFASFVLPAAGSWDLGLLVVAKNGKADLVLLPVEARLPDS